MVKRGGRKWKVEEEKAEGATQNGYADRLAGELAVVNEADPVGRGGQAVTQGSII
jgi:hypothetical protein